ncbi:MAG: ABC transporter ATP-binding protein [Anaerolineaceae bacterium]|jgi:branched-chain amino acid transport system ATP-binding protein
MTLSIEVSQVTKQFGGLTAVDNVDLVIPEHSIASIIGPNGAGKTTLFNCVSGYYSPEHGLILFNGQPIQGLPTHTIAELGIARTYQNIRLFKQMTALENILVGGQPHLTTSWWDAILHTRRFSHEEKNAMADAFRLLEHVGLGDLGDTQASNLPYGAQRRLEIARALANHPRLLLLDEPTAGMNPQETEAMAHFIAQLRDEFNLTIILIEHDMSVVMGISEQITVLDHGIKIAEGKPEEIRSNPRVIEAYLGTGTQHLIDKFRRNKRHAA